MNYNYAHNYFLKLIEHYNTCGVMQIYIVKKL